MATKADRYEGIDGLKAYAIIGIALMHVLANGEYGVGGFVFERLIPSFTNLVFLFMMVSGFGMCCGDRKSTRLNSSHITRSRMPSSA